MSLDMTLLPNSLHEPVYQSRWEKLKTRIKADWQGSIQFVDPDGKPVIPHAKQRLFIDSTAKRKIIRAGRRGGKTTGIAIYAVEQFKKGRRILYTAPTQEQVDAFWEWVKLFLAQPLESKALYKNETRHIIEDAGTKNRIRAKTAWDADSLRGDYADLLIFDEYQLTNEEAWGRVGAPMLLDNNGDAVFIYTPPSLHSRSRTKAVDPHHAAKLFKKAQRDTSGRWEVFHFSSLDNPHLSRAALDEITGDMTALAYDQEILALDKDEAPGALWSVNLLERTRVRWDDVPDLVRIVIGVDPPGGAVECGIVVAGRGINGHYYALADVSLKAGPHEWAQAVLNAYDEWEADCIVAETNFGGDMVQSTIEAVDIDRKAKFKPVHASRGKAVRAEPVAAQYEQDRAHHVETLPILEGELTMWEPGISAKSPNRLDALVWAMTELKENQSRGGTFTASGRKL